MCLKKNRKKNKKPSEYENRISDTAYQTVREALQSILTTDVKKSNTDGKEVTDLSLTISAIRMKARIALDFVDNLKNGIGESR